jgi:hypothetical protein
MRDLFGSGISATRFSSAREDNVSQQARGEQVSLANLTQFEESESVDQSLPLAVSCNGIRGDCSASPQRRSGAARSVST